MAAIYRAWTRRRVAVAVLENARPTRGAFPRHALKRSKFEATLREMTGASVHLSKMTFLLGRRFRFRAPFSGRKRCGRITRRTGKIDASRSRNAASVSRRPQNVDRAHRTLRSSTRFFYGCSGYHLRVTAREPALHQNPYVTPIRRTARL